MKQKDESLVEALMPCDASGDLLKPVSCHAANCLKYQRMSKVAAQESPVCANKVEGRGMITIWKKEVSSRLKKYFE